MPTKKEREYYRMGFQDGERSTWRMGGPREGQPIKALQYDPPPYQILEGEKGDWRKPKPKRKLSAWNKFVKANSRKKEFR